MNKIICLIFVCLFFLFSTSFSYAIYNPLSVANNKLGIHIIDENDLENAAALVNSSGGDWGYVTIVLPDYDRNSQKWQSILDKMNRLHLIPLIRIATHPHDDYWAKPHTEDAENWSQFLGSLYWYNRNRYIILFNEPNHAKEWGNTVSPVEYAQVLESFSKSLKQKSEDFFILPAGLDASAPDGDITMDERTFISQMVSYKPDIFNNIDGWTSHSYPNPAFRGSIEAWGKGTIRTYLWEREYLASLGVKNNFPIFITETGWPHLEGITTDKKYYDENKTGDFILYALKNIWDDSQIAAVTPFVLNYQSFPFANFSWQKPGNGDFYTQFDIYRSYPKTSGKPIFNIWDVSNLYTSIDHISDVQNQFSTLKAVYFNKFLSFRRLLNRFISSFI